MLRSLKGVHLAFTGILSGPRGEAARPRDVPERSSMARRRRSTKVVVRGRPNPLQAAGRDGGRKLMEIKRLREKGHASRCSTRRSSGGWPGARAPGRNGTLSPRQESQRRAATLAAVMNTVRLRQRT